MPGLNGLERKKNIELMRLYWLFSRKLHTNPKLRIYRNEVSKILSERRVSVVSLNDVGVKMKRAGII